MGQFFTKTTIAFTLFIFFFQNNVALAQDVPKILTSSNNSDNYYLPDFSYAGYQFGEEKIPNNTSTVLYAKDFGVIPNDGLDDSKALLKALDSSKQIAGAICLQLPPGRIILSEILYLERSHFRLRGAGSGEGGTEIYCPRPMMYLEDPEVLAELREYLTTFDKRQREPENNIDLPFSQYAWSGGMIWTQIPNERVKSYLGKYDQPQNIVANIKKGNRGEHIIEASAIHDLKVGDVVELQLFNTTGKNSSIIEDLYKKTDVKIGSHHWKFPTLPIVRQQVMITKISGKKITIKAPLTVSIKPEYQAQLVEWRHLKEVGIEHLKITFPDASYVAHHVERGFNGIFLTRVFNSWVNDVVIHNADSGILTEEIANVTISNIITQGNNLAHYTVAAAGVHNVLIKNLKVFNAAVHPLSFNTFSTKNVYKDCEVFVNPILDQHSGANHQNLFDNITVHIKPDGKDNYPLFAGGGAPYWKPSHGAFSTFWNINVQAKNGLNRKQPLLLDGMKDGPFARVIGVHGNIPLKVDYGPNSYIEFTNNHLKDIPSLYDYQLEHRQKK